MCVGTRRFESCHSHLLDMRRSNLHQYVRSTIKGYFHLETIYYILVILKASATDEEFQKFLLNTKKCNLCELSDNICVYHAFRFDRLLEEKGIWIEEWE